MSHAIREFGSLRARVVGDLEAPSQPVVVLLHGFGAPGDDLVSLHRALRVPAGSRFVFPEAPLELGPEYLGGRAWWPIDFEERMRRRARGDFGLDETPAGLAEANQRLGELLAEVRGQLKPSKLVLGGFSQGSMLAMDVALRSTAPLDGLVLLSTTILARAAWTERFAQRRGVPVFMSHGKHDPILPFFIADELRQQLEAERFDVTWQPFHGGHEIPLEVLEGASVFLGRVLG